jgi:hypothetical protein
VEAFEADTSLRQRRKPLFCEFFESCRKGDLKHFDRLDFDPAVGSSREGVSGGRQDGAKASQADNL